MAFWSQFGGLLADEELEAWNARQEQIAAEIEYTKLSSQPQGLPRITSAFNANTTAMDGTQYYSPPVDPTEALKKYQTRIGEKTDEFVALAEEAFHRNGGEIPREWWLEQSPGDLQLLNDPDLDALARAMQDQAMYDGIQAKQQELIDRAVQERITQKTLGNKVIALVNTIGQLGAANVPGAGLVGAEVPGVPLMDIDPEAIERVIRYGELPTHVPEPVSSDPASWAPDWVAAAYRNEESKTFAEKWNETIAELANPKTWITEIDRQFGGVLRPLGAGVSTATGFIVESTLRGLDQELGRWERAVNGASMADIQLPRTLGFLEERQQEKFDNTVQGLVQVGMLDPEIRVDQMIMGSINEEWEYHTSEADKNRYIEMANGNEIQAMGFFAADRLEDSEVRDQHRYYVDQLSARERDMLSELEPFDFSIGAGVLDVLSIWGDFTLQGATFMTLLIEDAWSGEFSFSKEWVTDIADAMEAADYTPSKAMGLDGTMLGLVADLTGGVAMDPFTWFTGPAAMHRLRPWTVTQASDTANSLVIRRVVQDLIRNAEDPTKGIEGAMHHLMSLGLDDEGIETTMALIGYSDNVLPAGTWREGAGGALATRVELSTIGKLPRRVDVDVEISDAQNMSQTLDELFATGQVGPDMMSPDAMAMSFARGPDSQMAASPENFADLRQAFDERGLDEALVIDISIRDGSIRLGDGAKRAAVGMEMGERRLPTVVRLVDIDNLSDVKYNELFPGAKNLPVIDDLVEAADHPLGNKLKVLRADDVEERRLGEVIEDELSDLMGPDMSTELLTGQAFYMSPNQLFDTETVLGKIPTAEVQALVAASIANGATPGLGSHLHLSAFAGRVMAEANKTGPGAWVGRYFGGYGTTRNLALGGPNSINEIFETLLTLYGHDIVEARSFITQIFDSARSAGRQRLRGIAVANEATETLEAAQRTSNLYRNGASAFEGNMGGEDIVNMAQRLWHSERARMRKDRLSHLADRASDVEGGPPPFEANIDPQDIVHPDDAGVTGSFDLPEQGTAFPGAEPLTGPTGRPIRPIPEGPSESGPYTATPRELRPDEMGPAPTRREWLEMPESIEESLMYLDEVDTAVHEEVWVDLQRRLQAGEAINQNSPGILEAIHDLGETALRRGGQIEPDEIEWFVNRWQQVARNRRQLAEAQSELERRAETLNFQADRYFAGNQDHLTSLQGIVREAFEHYKDTYIKPRWKNRLNEAGELEWETLTRGLPESHWYPGEAGYFPHVTVNAAAESDAANLPAGVSHLQSQDINATFQALSGVANSPTNIELPLSPLHMILARSWAGSKWTRMTQISQVNTIRNFAFDLNRLWVIDKVFRPATAITVSFDELLRIWHLYGMEGAAKWMGDRGNFMRARAHALLRHGKIKDGVPIGSQYLPDAVQDRFRRLTLTQRDMLTAERELFEGHGLQWGTIYPGQRGYEDAARRWTGQVLQDDGFRAYLRGKEAFREWYTGPTSRLENGRVIIPAPNRFTADTIDDIADSLLTWEDHYDGWTTILHWMTEPAAKAGRRDELITALRETAEQIDPTTGSRLVNLPEWVLEYLGPITGTRKHLPGRASISALTEPFFDAFFMNPVNYRRGLLAELARTTERQRLESLFASRGLKVMSDIKVEAVLGLKGYHNVTRGAYKGHFNRLARQEGIVTESAFEEILERRVKQEISNTLYTFDVGSRAGLQSKAVFPFGKPWADMAGFWGREMLRRPVARGFINNSNYKLVQGIGRGIEKLPPGFNRTNALLSRLAATDFTIDEGWYGEGGGLLPGSEETDFSPLFFLPTGGEDPFGVLLPGLGVVPIWFLDRYIDSIDPIENPLEYQHRIETLAQIIPAARFQQGQLASRLFGGGTANTALLTVANIFSARTGNSSFGFSSWVGDISREVDWGRQLSIMLAEDGLFAEGMAFRSVADVQGWLQTLASDANKAASARDMGPRALRFMAPVGSRESSAVLELQDLWVEAGTTFGDYFGEIQGYDLDDENSRRRYADAVRNKFYDLEDWERDLLVVQQESLAANLIGSWKWAPRAKDDAVPGWDQPYRTSGGEEALALHENLVNLGYVEPRTIDKVLLTTGIWDSAVRNTIKRAYEGQVESINDLLWENFVSPESVAVLELLLSSEFAQDRAYQDVRQVWDNWGTVEEEFEEWLSSDVSEETAKNMRAAIKLDDHEKPWGTGWRGLDDEKLTDRFRDFPMLYTEQTLQAAEALGMNLPENATGAQFFAELQRAYTAQQAPLLQLARPAYKKYLQERGVVSSEGVQTLLEQIHNPLVNEEWAGSVEVWLERTERQAENEYEDNGSLSQATMLEVSTEFQRLAMTAGSELNIDWRALWDGTFKRTFGELGWQQPEPKSPFDENGNQVSTASTPYIVTVTDGDTIVYRDRDPFGSKEGELRQMRLLGLRAPELGDGEAGLEAKRKLQDAILEARQNGDTIWFVRQPEIYGNVDPFGRQLAWLWIGDEPYYEPGDLLPTRDPSG